MSSASESYSLLQQDIIPKLLADRDWFLRCIAWNFDAVAREFGCSVQLSGARLSEAFYFWTEDEGRTLREGIETGTSELDHFKQASFIAFWLRRMLPINTTQWVGPKPGFSVLYVDRDLFLRYGNEICALLIGFQICLFYEVARVISEENGTVVPFIPAGWLISGKSDFQSVYWPILSWS